MLRNRETNKDEFEELLQQLTEANKFIEKEVQSFENDKQKESYTPKVVQDAYKKAVPILKKIIPAFREVISSRDAINEVILKPVSAKIKSSSRTNFWFGLFGLVVGVLGIVASVFSNLDVRNETSFKGISLRSNKPSGEFYNQISLELGANSIDSKLRIFQSQLETICSNENPNIYLKLKDEFSKLFEQFNYSNLGQIQKDKASLLWVLIELNNPLFNENGGLKTELLAALQGLSQCEDLHTATHSEWLLSDIYYFDKQFTKCEASLERLNVNEDFEVYNIEEKRFESLLNLAEHRKMQIKECLKKEKTKIVLLNETLPRISGYAELCKKKLIDIGFKDENIICLTGAETSTIFGYYNDLESKEVLKQVIQNLYSNSKKLGVDLTKISNSRVPRIKKICEEYEADIIIRLPHNEV